MKCPVCKSIDLIIAERQGVEIDYCPDCRGIWLDRGELDKIIERSYSLKDSPAQNDGQHGRDHNDHGRGHYDGHGHNRHHKRKSWLAEIFD